MKGTSKMKITYKMKLTHNKNNLRNAAAVKNDGKGQDEDFMMIMIMMTDLKIIER